MGLAARMLSSELEMYPMIAVAHEIAMVRTAGSICMARSAPGSLGHRREPAAAPAERAANLIEGENERGGAKGGTTKRSCRSRDTLIREHAHTKLKGRRQARHAITYIL